MKFTRAGIWVVGLICLTGCTTAVKTVMFHHPKAKSRFVPPEPDRIVTGEAWLATAGEGTNEITVLHVKAENHYSIGYHHGKLLATNVAAGIEDVLLGASAEMILAQHHATAEHARDDALTLRAIQQLAGVERVHEQLGAVVLDDEMSGCHPPRPRSS